jgi:phosphoadenosine phosphosulfate reductase
MEGKPAQDILTWATREFQPGLSMACSFGGPTGMVLLDMVMRIDPTVEVFYLDTDFLFPETYHLRDVCEQKYGFKPIGYKSLLTPEAQASQHGPELWTRDPDLCCELRKVEPNQRALEGKTAWISGMRRDQSKTRANVAIVDWDEKFGLVKLNPLATWDEKQVWAYILANEVPASAAPTAPSPCAAATTPVPAAGLGSTRRSAASRKAPWKSCTPPLKETPDCRTRDSRSGSPASQAPASRRSPRR